MSSRFLLFGAIWIIGAGLAAQAGAPRTALHVTGRKLGEGENLVRNEVASLLDRVRPESTWHPIPAKLDPIWQDKRLSQWLDALAIGNREQRLSAAQALKNMLDGDTIWKCCGGPSWPTEHLGAADAPEAVAVLVNALSDLDADVRNAAIAALECCGPFAAPAIPALRELLTDGACRVAAANALGRLGATSITAVPDLRHLLATDGNSFRMLVAKALWRINHDPDAFNVLSALLERDLAPGGGNIHFRPGNLAYFFQSEIGTAAIPLIPKLIAALRCGDDPSAMGAEMVIVGIGPAAKEAIPELIRRVDLSRPDFYALQALASIGPPAHAAVPKIIARYRSFYQQTFNEDPGWVRSDRERILRTLAYIGAPRDAILELLGEELDNRDVNRAQFACNLVSQLGDEAAPVVPSLIRVLRSKPWTAQRAACEALGEIGPAARDAVPELALLLASSSSDYVIEAIGRIGSSAANVVPELEARLKSPESAVAAAVALWRIAREPSAIEVLARCLDAGDPNAARALGALGRDSRPALGALRRAAKNEGLALVALEAWWHVEPDQAVLDSLRKRMNSKNPDVAVNAAAIWLKLNQAPDARRFLELAVFRTNDFARYTARSALQANQPPTPASRMRSWW